MRALRKLLLGETVVLPAGVAVIAGLALLADALLDAGWSGLAGPVVLVATAAVLWYAVAVSAPPPRPPET